MAFSNVSSNYCTPITLTDLDAQFTENMKDDGQGQKEAINLMTYPKRSKESCRIGTWNGRTMNELTKTAQIVREMTSNN